jgi:hypothetical protein
MIFLLHGRIARKSAYKLTHKQLKRNITDPPREFSREVSLTLNFISAIIFILSLLNFDFSKSKRVQMLASPTPS